MPGAGTPTTGPYRVERKNGRAVVVGPSLKSGSVTLGPEMADALCRVLNATHAAAYSAGLEAAARVFDAKAWESRGRAQEYIHNRDSLGRRHPCPSSARECEQEAVEFAAHAAAIRALAAFPDGAPNINESGRAASGASDATASRDRSGAACPDSSALIEAARACIPHLGRAAQDLHPKPADAARVWAQLRAALAEFPESAK